MGVLFHQNMRVFGGGAPARNAAYQQQLAAIQATIAGAGAGPVDVAGFTEVTNNGAAAAAFGAGGVGGGLCNALGVNHVGNIACGQTVLAHGPEYIALGVNPALPIVRVGRIFLSVDVRGINLIDDIAPMPITAAWCNQIHPFATYDYRGLVYVVVTVGGVNISIGFLHNLYTFVAQRILVMGKLPYMMNLMGNGLGPVANYIGGDFNVPVLSPRGTARIGFCHAYSDPLAAAPAIPGGAAAYFPPPPPPPFVAGGTTWRGSLYDYWFSTIDPAGPIPGPLMLPVPSVSDDTLDSVTGVLGGSNNMSDHCAIDLEYR